MHTCIRTLSVCPLKVLVQMANNIKRTLLGKGPSPSVRYSRQTHLQNPNFRNLNNRPGIHRTNQDSNFNSANLDFDIAAAIQRTFNFILEICNYTL